MSYPISTKDLINGYKILNGSRYFSSATLQIHLSIVYIKKYFRLFTNFRLFIIGLSEESDETITTSDSNFAVTLINCYPIPDIKYSKWFRVHLYIGYELDRWSRDLDTNFTLANWLFGSVKLTKNVDSDKDKYSSYSREFDSCSEFLFTDGSYGKNVIFGADMSSSVHVDNKRKDILILINDATLTAEAH